MTGTYHVVCHDCDFERVVDEEGEARIGADYHRGSTGRGDDEPHNVEYARIDA